jgi:periplasmic copper chaperone A
MEAVNGASMFGLSKPRIFEIGVAVLLTLAALVLVGWTAWAAEAELQISDGWARSTGPKGRMTAAYFTVSNAGTEADTLKAARSPKAKSVEVHETTITADGVMQMRHVHDGLAVPAGGALVLKPGGAHLMIMGLEEALEAGTELPLSLEFARAGLIEVSVPVQQNAP